MLPFTTPAAFGDCLELAQSLGGACGEPGLSELLERLCLKHDAELWVRLRPLRKQGIVSISERSRLVHLLGGGWARLAEYDIGRAAIAALEPARKSFARTLEAEGGTIEATPPVICRLIMAGNPLVTDAGKVLGLAYLGQWEGELVFRKLTYGRWLLRLVH